MAQLLRPASDVSDGAWVPSAGADLYATIDETSASDADYGYTLSESAFEVALSPGTDPASSAGHTVRYRAAGNGVLDLRVTLLQGTTTIAEWTEAAAAAAFTDYSHTLAGAEADAITDYTDLRLRFTLESAAAAIGLEGSTDDILLETGDVLLSESGTEIDISAMDAAATLTGAEVVALVQGGVTVKATIDQIKTLVNS